MKSAMEQISEWRQDAERYRWLVENAIRIDITTEKQMFSMYGRELTAVLDVAMRDSSNAASDTSKGAKNE